MANSATAVVSARAYIKAGVARGLLKTYKVVLDTNADLTVHTPASNAYAAIVGLTDVNTGAAVVDVISGSTTLVSLDLPANRVVLGRVDPSKPIVVCAQGEALKLNPTTGTVPTMLVHVMEMETLDLRS